MCDWPIRESLSFEVNQWHKDWFTVQPQTLLSYLDHSSMITWTITCHHYIDKMVRKKLMGLSWWNFKPLKNSCSYWLSPGNIPRQKCCVHVYFPPPPSPGMKQFAEATQTAPGSSTNTCDRLPAWLSKMGKLKTRVLNMSQTVGIDYHLFKSETKVGQLQ